jgi:uncharacterized protein
MRECRTKSILALDGGGVRGLVSAVMLEALEQKLQALEPNRPLSDYFDLLAGTSAGSIIACGLAKGMSAQAIKQFYLDKALTIFPRFPRVVWSFIQRISAGSISRPLYDGKGLEQVLQHPTAFGFLRFGELPKPVLVTSYDLYNRQAVIFLSTKTACQQLLAWEVCRASAAVPIAFPAYLLSEPTFLQFWESQGFAIPTLADKVTLPLIDGGVAANNPTMLALAERLRWEDKPKYEDILLVSLGTGQSVKAIAPKTVKDWGPLEWINPGEGIPLMDVLFDGSSDASDAVAKLLLSSGNVYRFQPTFTQNFAGFNANPEKLTQLETLTRQFIEQPGQQKQLEILAHQLVSRWRACQ